MTIDTKKIASLLGDQVKFITTKTENVHDKKGGKVVNAEAAEWALKESKEQSNAKVLVNSAPEGYVWVVIDYDDHKGNGKLDTLREDFNLPKTFTVKTPSGSGRHEWYLLQEEQARKLHKWSHKIPKYPNTDILIGHKDLKQAFVAPGSKKGEGEYELTNGISPVDLPEMVVQTLLAQVKAESTDLSKIIEENRIAFNSKEVDSQVNKGQYLDYLARITRPFELGSIQPLEDGDGRNGYLYGWACQGFTHNLSPEVVTEYLNNKIVYNSVVMQEPLHDEEVELTINSAYKRIDDERRTSERATSDELVPYEFDINGNRTVTYEQHTKKLLFLTGKGNHAICNNENLRRLLCETIVYDKKSGNFYIARIKSYKQYEKNYNHQMIDEERKKIIDLDGILNLYSETMLHWDIISERQLNTEFSYISGKGLKRITSWPEFKVYSFSCNVYSHTFDEQVLIEDDNFYHIDRSPIRPLKEITKKERAKVNKLLESHIHRIVDPNHYDRESSWLLDRYALLLQNQNERSENILIIKGPQGTGKTSFITIMHHLFPSSKFITHNDVKALDDKFLDKRHLTHIDDINIKRNGEDLENFLKSYSSTSMITREVKFQAKTVTWGSVNFSMTTNNEIDVNEFLTGRRFTILENTEVVNIDSVAQSVHNTLLELKKDNFHLYRVLATMMLERDTSKFDSKFKSEAQIKAQLLSNKGNTFGIALANMIANYGYISPDCQVVVPKEPFNRRDFYTAVKKHWYQLDNNKDNIVEPIKLRAPESGKGGNRIESLFSTEKHKSNSIAAMYKTITDDAQKQLSSRINPAIAASWSTVSPSMQDWIKLLTLVVVGNIESGSIEYIVDKYTFSDQWNWDGNTKPELKGLGTINIFDHIEIESSDEDEYDEQW